jgi:Ca2+-binding EF-hand superfamily protein
MDERELVEYCTGVFRNFDQNKDGSLSVQEIGDVMTKLNGNVRPDESEITVRRDMREP